MANLFTYGAFAWFLFVTFYHTDPTGQSWMLYHIHQLFFAYVLLITALPFYVYAIVRWIRER